MIRQKGFNSFFGNFTYKQLVPKNHFLRKVNELINWLPVIQKITPCYKGKFTLGASALNPITLFKMMFLGYLYDISDRDLERLCNDTISFKYFIEIAIDESAPDHSTLSLFRKRIIKHYGDESCFESIFIELLEQIMDTDIKLGNIQAIDSKQINARASKHRQNKKTKKQQEKERKTNNKRKANGKKLKDFRSKCDIDKEASIGCKGVEKQTTKDGKKVEMLKWFFGYKAHCSVESNYDLITSAILTAGNKADGNYFEPLLWKDMSLRGEVKGYTADRGYDYGDNHFLLNQLEFDDGIYLKGTRLKDDKMHAIWHTLNDSREHKEAKSHRFKVERTFGDLNNNHTLTNCRYFGRVKTAIQMFMSAMAHNVKKAIKVLYGIAHKSPPPTTLVSALQLA